jgi:hypothetical protein
LLLLFILYYFYFDHGPPVRLHEYLNYGNGDSWLYTYGRPTAGVVFIGVGMAAEIHPVLRFSCLIGCVVEVFGDSLSAFQVRDYYNQVKFHDAPSHGYSSDEFLAYYYRDIVSIGVCTVIIMLVGLLTVVVGLCEPQFIHPSLISGNELDRYAALTSLRTLRRIMGMSGILGPKVPVMPLGAKGDPVGAAILAQQEVDESLLKDNIDVEENACK